MFMSKCICIVPNSFISLLQHEPGSTMGNCESTTAGNRLSLGGSSGSRLTGYPSPNTAADAIIKDEPDFVETHCNWVGCDRDLHTQEQLVKVLLLVLPMLHSI